MNREPFAGFSGTYIYVRGRQLEGTYSNDPSIGMWGITACRVVRGWGNAPRALFPVPETWPPEEPESLDAAAKENRVLTYQRVRSAGEAIKLPSKPNAVSASFEITEQWFDAPGGVVTVPEPHDEIIRAHAVAIVGFKSENKTFQFVNSWGTEWGDSGFGYLPLQYFDRHFQESVVYFCGLIGRKLATNKPFALPANVACRPRHLTKRCAPSSGGASFGMETHSPLPGDLCRHVANAVLCAQVDMVQDSSRCSDRDPCRWMKHSGWHRYSLLCVLRRYLTKWHSVCPVSLKSGALATTTCAWATDVGTIVDGGPPLPLKTIDDRPPAPRADRLRGMSASHGFR